MKNFFLLLLCAVSITASSLHNNDSSEEQVTNDLDNLEDANVVVLDMTKFSENVEIHSEEQTLPHEILIKIFNYVKPNQESFRIQQSLNHYFASTAHLAVERAFDEKNLEEWQQVPRFWKRALLASAAAQQDDEFSEQIVDNFSAQVDTGYLIQKPSVLFKLIAKRPYYFRLPIGLFICGLLVIFGGTIMKFIIPDFITGMLTLDGVGLLFLVFSFVQLIKTYRLFEKPDYD